RSCVSSSGRPGAGTHRPTYGMCPAVMPGTCTHRSNLRRRRVVPPVGSSADGRALLGTVEGLTQAPGLDLGVAAVAVAVSAVLGVRGGQLGRGHRLDTVLIEEAGQALERLVLRGAGAAHTVLVLGRLDLEHAVGLVVDEQPALL